MDGSQIESLLVYASAKAARALQRITAQLDFCTAGMKRDEETRDFLFQLEFAANELIDASARVTTIRELYRRASEQGAADTWNLRRAQKVDALFQRGRELRAQTGDQAEAAGRADYQRATEGEGESDMERDRR